MNAKIVGESKMRKDLTVSKYLSIKCLLITKEKKNSLYSGETSQTPSELCSKLTIPAMGQINIMCHLIGYNEKNTTTSLL